MSKIALITGGNRGLGRATALALLDAGVEVVYTHRGDPGEKIDAVPLELTVGKLETYDDFATELRRVLRDRFGRDDFDFLVNNAGVGVHASIADTTVEAFDELLNVHWRGMFFLTQKLLPLIADGGRIINLSTGLASVIALGRVGEPEEIGGVIAALLGDGTGWINGQRIEASGGMRL